MIRAVPIGQNAAIHLLQIILSDLHFHNTFQFIKYGAAAEFFFHCFRHRTKSTRPVNEP